MNAPNATAPHDAPAIELTRVSKVFQTRDSRVEALRDVDFAAERGQLIAVVGPSGSGKSTFLQVMGGLQSPTSGAIALDGEPYQDLSVRQREQLRLNTIGFVLQTYSLVPYLTVAEQFELVRRVKRTPNLADDAFAGVLERLGIEQLIGKYPEALSGGQRQRVAIARALYADPKIVLADEPTAALDTDRAFEVMKIFRDLTHATGKTIVVVTHDTRLERYVDALYSITDGTIHPEEVGAAD